jgi:ABC-type Zn uptake system ZnuABC Zn-binding protein ZnuA
MRHLRTLLLLALWTTALPAAERPAIVCTTSLGATAVLDLAGDAVAVETLMPAGTCPGQFDLDPGQVRRVRAAVLVVRHEMQGFLDERFAAAGVRPEVVVAIPFGTAFDLPGNYAQYCAALAAELVKRVPALAATTAPRLAAIRARAEALEAELRRATRPLAGTPVVAALFQTDFLRWLGLNVVVSYPPMDDPAPAALKAAIATGRARQAALVVGNEQNGPRATTLIAGELGVAAVTLSNFPARSAGGAYWELVEANLKALLDWQATQKKRP